MSFFLPLGAGIAGSAYGALRGSKKPKKVNLLDPQQQSIFDSLVQAAQGGGGVFEDLVSYDPQRTSDLFNTAVAEPLINQFNEQILPGITGQFRGKGLGTSTYAGQAAARAGEGLERQLASQLANTQNQAYNQSQQNLSNILSKILNTQTYGYKQPTTSPFDQLIAQLTGQSFGLAGDLYKQNPF